LFNGALELIRTIDLRKAPSSGPTAIERAGSLPSAQRSLDPHSIAFITAVKDEAQYHACLRYLDALEIPRGHQIERIAVFGGASMAECYQQAMDASTSRYKIYLHADAHVVHRGLLSELLHLFRSYPRLGLVGVVGSTWLPPGGLWWVNNPFHSYGRLWQNSRPGFPMSILWPATRERLHLVRFRSFVGDYLPAAVVDGFFMATQYDLPWTRPFFGFDLCDHVQALEFIRAGFEVGIARQEAIWCIHRGPAEEPSTEQLERRDLRLREQTEALRNLYPESIGVPARKLYRDHLRVPAIPGFLDSSKSTRDRLGVVIVTFNGREVLLRALRALLPQCEQLQEVDCSIVVVDNASTDGTVETIRHDFPEVTLIANGTNDGPARGFNLGLRHLGFPAYVLVMNNDVEFLPGTLSRMVDYLRKHPAVAGVVASLTNPDGTVQFQRTAIVELIRRHPRRPQPVTFVGTTCALVRGEVFFDVGLYDERFYFYNEDLDWSLRAKRKGYKFVFLPEVRVIHHQGVGLRQNRPAILAELFVANLRFLHKHAGVRWAVILYWVQRLQGKWFAYRWRNDPEALRLVSEAVARMEALYRRIREENRLPRHALHTDA